MRKLLIYLKDYKKESILGPLFKLLEASFELIVPLVVASMIDVGIPAQDKGYIVKMALVLVALGIIGLTSSVTAQFFAAKAAVGFATKVRHALFEHIQKLTFGQMDSQGTATLITRMTSDVNQVQNGVNLVLRLFLRSPFIVFGAMIMAFTVDVKAALIFVVVIPLLLIVVFAILLISIPMFGRVQANLDQVMRTTRENLTGSRVIRAFAKEPEEIEEFRRENRVLRNVQVVAGRVSALMNPVTYIIINGGLMALIYVGALQIEGGILSQGQVVALINYMSQILVELIKLANLIITVTKAIACGNRIEAVMEIPAGFPEESGETGRSPMQDSRKLTEPKKGSGESGISLSREELPRENCPYKVVFDQVGMAYNEGGDEAISDVNLKVRKGETIGVIGGTGSGKSTLVNLIPRFYDVTRGRVLVDGIDVRDMDPERLRSKIGMVLQKAVLFRGTIRENLFWGNEGATDEEIWKALETAQAKEFVEQKEDGLDTMIEQEGRNLSGGQRQRLSIARALVRKPEILILDDSSSALDYATDLKLRQAIKALPGDMTVFIVSQRASSLMHADQILVLDDGDVVGLGTHEELLKSCETYREIYNTQIEKKTEQQDGREA
jgi:ATP-binding cassette subfamily B multidrug efflux pump